MNVTELNGKYQRIVNWNDEYRKELVSYINEAFAMHGNEFVLKPEGFDTWEEARMSEEFNAMDDLPTYVMIWDRHEFSHEIYPTRAYRESEQGLIYIDGYDYTEGEFVTDWYVNNKNDDLASIACFINAVLEQENGNVSDNALKGKSNVNDNRKVLGYQLYDKDGNLPEDLYSFMVFESEKDARDYMECEKLEGFSIVTHYEGDIEDPEFVELRILKKGERVFNNEPSPGDSDLRDWATVCEDTAVLYDDQIVLLDMENGGENETDADSVYQIAEGEVCPKCGGPLCIEHDPEVDYPYYCPECDENFYGFETW